MIFEQTSINGVILVKAQPISDDRGFFSRFWCSEEFGSRGLLSEPTQGNIAFTRRKGTLRGLHYQLAPHEDAKLVRCISGSIFDVAVDLRLDSPTYLKWCGHQLSAKDHDVLYIPEGFAHGYQALEDNTEILYLVSKAYSPEHEVGLRWNDPTVGIEWPLSSDLVISEKDRAWPDYIANQ